MDGLFIGRDLDVLRSVMGANASRTIERGVAFSDYDRMVGVSSRSRRSRRSYDRNGGRDQAFSDSLYLVFRVDETVSLGRIRGRHAHIFDRDHVDSHGERSVSRLHHDRFARFSMVPSRME